MKNQNLLSLIMDCGGAFQAPFGPPKETALSLSLVMALMGHAATVHSAHSATSTASATATATDCGFY